MKKSILIQILTLFLFVFLISCQQQDSSLVSPEESFELTKKGGNGKPPSKDPEPKVIYDVVFVAKAGDIEDGLNVPNYPEQTDGQFFNAKWMWSPVDECFTIPVNTNNGTEFLFSGAPELIVQERKGKILGFAIWVQDEVGGIMHSTEPFYFDFPVLVNTEGFDLVVNDEINIYKYSNRMGGKRDKNPLGTISIARIQYTPAN
ncbi:hypothetical protein ACFLS9_01735 [Bacteroidota bacterium]